MHALACVTLHGKVEQQRWGVFPILIHRVHACVRACMHARMHAQFEAALHAACCRPHATRCCQKITAWDDISRACMRACAQFEAALVRGGELDAAREGRSALARSGAAWAAAASLVQLVRSGEREVRRPPAHPV
jgi:hypothetical protein